MTGRSCVECETWIDTRCPECGCCNHEWNEDTCPCASKGCGCRENREWDEREAALQTPHAHVWKQLSSLSGGIWACKCGATSMTAPASTLVSGEQQPEAGA